MRQLVSAILIWSGALGVAHAAPLGASDTAQLPQVAAPPLEMLQENAKRIFLDQARDPDSVKFRWVSGARHYRCTSIKGRTQGWAMAFEVNGRNAYGGFSGWQPYLVMLDTTQNLAQVYQGPQIGNLGGVCRYGD